MSKIVDNIYTMTIPTKPSFSENPILQLPIAIFRIFLILFISLPVMSQATTKDSKTAPAPTTTEPSKTVTAEKKEETKPLKMETGTVTVDPQIVSADFKRNNLKNLRRLKSSFMNYEMEEKFSSIMKNYVDASIKFQEKNYITSRRIFEQNYTDLNVEAQNFVKKYSDIYNKLYADASFQLVDLKVNSDTDDSIYPVLEKQLVIANEFNTSAQILNAKNNHIDALYEQKNAMQSLFKIYYTINKHKNKNLKLQEKVSKNLLLDDDYIPKEYLKEYDDSLGFVFATREKERTRERDQIKKSITNKYGEMNLPKENEADDASSSEPKKDVKANDAKPEVKKDKPEIKDSKKPEEKKDTKISPEKNSEKK